MNKIRIIKQDKNGKEAVEETSKIRYGAPGKVEDEKEL